jgi:hypothetical protein
MIRPSRLRVALCFFGRIVPSDAPQNHGLQRKGITNEIARFGGLKLPIPAISTADATEIQTPHQALGLFMGDYLVDRIDAPLFRETQAAR